jgi:hypothetical protein
MTSNANQIVDEIVDEKLVNLWLTSSISELTEGIQEHKEYEMMERFVKASVYPSLLKTQEGNIAPMGEVPLGLHLGLKLNAYEHEYSADVYKVGSDGERHSVKVVTGDDTLPLVVAFIKTFPGAVVTTEEFKPLCLFEKIGDKGQKVFLGHLSFAELQSAYQREIKNISVGVP